VRADGEDRQSEPEPKGAVMTHPAYTIVVIDEGADARALAAAMRELGHPVALVPEPRVRARLGELAAAVMWIDASRVDLCATLHERYPHVLTIAVAAENDPDLAISAMRAGAFDFLVKPVSETALHDALSRAAAQLAVQLELEQLRGAAIESAASGIVASSPSIRDVLELVQRIANSDATVLVTGESGTGKELIARAIHDRSDRRTEPFVAIHCSAMTVPLLESELFGHVRGAFSGAERERVGLLLRAGRGTLLLDEIADMPLEMQAKLLRVLQERTVRPLGADEEMPLQARIVAATGRDLEREVALKRFREDLYHRVNVVTVAIPPLRERREDILPIAHVVLRRYAAHIGKHVWGITAPAARLIREYDWPGNVRELENCIERAVAICRLDQLTADDLPDRIGGSSVTATRSQLVTLAEMKMTYLRKALALCGGNKSMAARVLRIDRRTISSLLVSAKERDPGDPAVELD
jgi:two-component system response regulator HydG